MAATPERTPEIEQDHAVEPGYAEWKREKIERGLAQTRDRSAMIPVDRIWSDLGLEG